MRQVYCANCLRLQDDNGKGQTCEYCGCSPLPSYSYPAADIRHPLRCKCNKVDQPIAKVRPRRTPTPTIKK